ncbi:MAG TPA: DUF763 domain-containing protein [Syntrophorhabdaceae bacterium]|nr:DUF763 domain-containing protein [Syntrophorhabdaceae bacterium]HQM81030.1 DUF763 domain-containing protein [Syntrophorhabdaceae bacterium]
MKRSITSLPLHYGKAPPWLFQKMKRLSAALTEIILFEFGPSEFLARVADPVWFQALGCAVGFDWHSSGLTTTLCGALKEGVALLGEDASLAVCGGKAKRAIRTPEEIDRYGEKWGIDAQHLKTISRLCAKIDNTAVQDGYSLYHHTFIFTAHGEWAIIQQGMNGEKRDARRYQWLSKDNLDMTSDPHTGITCDERGAVLNFVAGESAGARGAAVDFAKENPDAMIKAWKGIALTMPERHYISAKDVNEKRLYKMFRLIHESQPDTFKDLIQIQGVGPRTVAALALVSELIYQRPPSFEDPARFSFAHGGKDGYPFPVDRKTYEGSIDFLKTCIDKAKVGDRDKLDALKRLSNV